MSGVCPLCRQGSKLDFHHWDYETDIGVKICRECHEHIHDGIRKTHQDNKAKSYGYSGWVTRAVNNLIIKDIAFLKPGEFDIQTQSWEEYRDRLKKRYNLPDKYVPDGASGHFLQVKHTGLPQQGTPSAWGFSKGGGSE